MVRRNGAQDYLIDLGSGDSKPLTPEGVTGVQLSGDGRNIAVVGPDGNWGIWPVDEAGFRPIPGLANSKLYVSDWTPDGSAVYVASNQSGDSANSVKIYRVNTGTGKMDFCKTFGSGLPPGTVDVTAPMLSADASAYAYVHVQVLSQAYVIKGLK